MTLHFHYAKHPSPLILLEVAGQRSSFPPSSANSPQGFMLWVAGSSQDSGLDSSTGSILIAVKHTFVFPGYSFILFCFVLPHVPLQMISNFPPFSGWRQRQRKFPQCMLHQKPFFWINTHWSKQMQNGLMASAGVKACGTVSESPSSRAAWR